MCALNNLTGMIVDIVEINTFTNSQTHTIEQIYTKKS